MSLALASSMMVAQAQIGAQIAPLLTTPIGRPRSCAPGTPAIATPSTRTLAIVEGGTYHPLMLRYVQPQMTAENR